MSPTLSGSCELHYFKHGNAVKMQCLMSSHLGLAHMLKMAELTYAQVKLEGKQRQFMRQ